MSRVVFDIETLAHPFESFDTVQQEYLLKFANTEEEQEAEIQKLALHAVTARVITIGMLNPDTNSGKVFFQSDREEQFTSEDGTIEYISGDEVSILQHFWEMITHYKQFITFNGRAFDCPFLMLRSAISGVKPSRNLVTYRFDASIHCDLLEQLTFYSAVRKFNLDFYCKAFNIKSPKSDGITGLDLGRLFQEGKFREIAEYCAGDIRSTAKLFHRWDEFMNVK